MARCPHCEYPLADDRERVGARCPSCHDPLYEPPGRFARPSLEGEATCALHAGMGSVGECARCSRAVCETCRTRWRGQVVCAACVERALSSSEATPAQMRSHYRQALASVVLGGGAWAVGVLAVVGIDRASGLSGPAAVVVMFGLFVLLAADVLLAAVGVGQAVAALLVPGFYRSTALTGLVLGGLFVGLALGAGTLSLWQG